MAHDVFISYSSEDKAIADSVCATLEGRRIRCWIAPRDVTPDVPYSMALIKSLSASRLLVLVFSSYANVSRKVAREVAMACDKGLVIVPLRIEDVPMSKQMEYYLSTQHWLDGLTPPLERHLALLADTVEKLLAPGAAMPDPPAAAPEPSSGSAPRETGLIDNAEMRRRIEETRFRLKAKAFDAMMGGDAAMPGCDDQPAAALDPDMQIDAEAESTIYEPALWVWDVEGSSERAASASDLPESRSMPRSACVDRTSGGLADESSEPTPSSWPGQSSPPSEDAPHVRPADDDAEHGRYSKWIPDSPFAQHPRPVRGRDARAHAARVRDSVDFTLAWPAAVVPGSTVVLDVWAHLGEERAEVLQRIDEEFVGLSAGKKTRSGARIDRGCELVVRLDIDGCIVDEPEEVMLWDGHMTSVDFIVSVPDDVLLGPRAGRVSVSVNGLRVSRIAFELDVAPTTVQRPPVVAGFPRHDRAFASYASADRDRVLSCVQGMETVTPLKVFVDVDALRSSGGSWKEQLCSHIDQSQVMYLFWSRAAEASEHVNWEWRYALERYGLEFIDPVPLEPPRLAQPPTELQALHFNSKWLLFMGSAGPAG